MERVTTLTAAVRAPLTAERRHLAGVTFIVIGLINIFVFGVLAHAGDASFELSLASASVKIPVIRVPAAPVCYALGAVAIGLGVLRLTVPFSRLAKRLAIVGVLACFLLSLLCWADAGAIPLNVIIISQGTITESIPLILGALAGCLCERSGVINIAIEGQLLFGAFTAAIVASAFGGLWVGLVAGSLSGGLVGLALAVFAISYLTDQIVLGVVLNVLVLGMTNYLYDRLMSQNPNYNTGITFGSIKIPVLSEIPIIGPIFFDSTVFLYITYIAIIVIQVAFFHTRWGLRVRTVASIRRPPTPSRSGCCGSATAMSYSAACSRASAAPT